MNLQYMIRKDIKLKHETRKYYLTLFIVYTVEPPVKRGRPDSTRRRVPLIEVFPCIEVSQTTGSTISAYVIYIEMFISLRVYWCVLDGADCNRLFIKMHFHNKDPVESKFVATNIYTGGPVIFIMDPKVKIYVQL